MNAKFESVEDDAGRVTRYVRHANGGGLIARGAEAAQTARIGPMTYVEHGARIGTGCRVGYGCWIDKEARIGDHAVIGDRVRIGRRTVIGSKAQIGSHSRIGSGAVVGHGSHLPADSTVPDGGEVLAEPRSPGQVAANRRPARRPGGRMAA